MQIVSQKIGFKENHRNDCNDQVIDSALKNYNHAPYWIAETEKQEKPKSGKHILPFSSFIFLFNPLRQKIGIRRAVL